METSAKWLWKTLVIHLQLSMFHSSVKLPKGIHSYVLNCMHGHETGTVAPKIGVPRSTHGITVDWFDTRVYEPFICEPSSYNARNGSPQHPCIFEIKRSNYSSWYGLSRLMVRCVKSWEILQNKPVRCIHEFWLRTWMISSVSRNNIFRHRLDFFWYQYSHTAFQRRSCKSGVGMPVLRYLASNFCSHDLGPTGHWGLESPTNCAIGN